MRSLSKSRRSIGSACTSCCSICSNRQEESQGPAHDRPVRCGDGPGVELAAAYQRSCGDQEIGTPLLVENARADWIAPIAWRAEARTGAVLRHAQPQERNAEDEQAKVRDVFSPAASEFLAAR